MEYCGSAEREYIFTGFPILEPRSAVVFGGDSFMKESGMKRMWTFSEEID